MSTLRLLRDFAIAAFGHAASDGDLADDEVERLERLAESIAETVSLWRDLAQPVWRLRPLDPARAGVIILETVFDEVLDAPRWRALASAFARACP